MDDQVTPEPSPRTLAEDKILRQMRAIRKRLDPALKRDMDKFAKAHMDEVIPPEKTQAKAAVKPIVQAKPDADILPLPQSMPKKDIPDDCVPYDRDRAMEAVGQFIAGRKDDHAFMTKMVRLFQNKE